MIKNLKQSDGFPLYNREKGDIIVLKDMDLVYPKFYDLFNQNFEKSGNDYYAKIFLVFGCKLIFIVYLCTQI